MSRTSNITAIVLIYSIIIRLSRLKVAHHHQIGNVSAELGFHSLPAKLWADEPITVNVYT